MPEDSEGVEARIAKVAAARDQAKAEAAELRTKLATMEAEVTPLRAIAAKYETEAKTWANERVFLEVGVVDPEAREVAAFIHGKIPEAERPELGAWLKAIKAEPAKAPRALQGYFAAPAANDAKTEAKAETPGDTRAAPLATLVTTTGTTGSVTAGQIKAARERAEKSGDWKEFDQLSQQMFAQRNNSR